MRPEAETIAQEEETLLAKVQARAAVAEPEGDGGPGLDYDKDLISLRDQIAEAKPEDLGPLVEQMMRVQAIAARRGRSRTLPVDLESPYFAHMRLEDRAQRGGSARVGVFRPRDVLIGKRGFVDRQSGIQIVDWRNAPVSQIYYRYDEGDDYDETFEGGRLEGVVAARRNVSIATGKLRRIGCPQGTFVKDLEGAWQEATGQATPTLQGGSGTAARPKSFTPVRKLGVHHGDEHRADKHLPEIAALIDKEQFALITEPQSGLVVIQGGAGSGKTTVALHRVAYLNYADSRRFSPNKLLVVVPSPSLARYIEGVLPALGVQGVQVTVSRAFARNMRKKLVPRAGHRYADDCPDVVLRLKKHPALLPILEEYVARQVAALEDELPTELMDRWEELAKDPLVKRLGRLAAWVGKQGDALPIAVRNTAEPLLRRLRRRAADVVADWEEILSDAALLGEAFARLAPGDVKPEEISKLVRWVTDQRQVPPEVEHAGVDAERMRPIDELYKSIEDVPIDEGPGDRRKDRERERDREKEKSKERRTDDGEWLTLDEDDDPIFLRLHQLKQGGLVERREGQDPRDHRYEHIAIDEAQDFSALEIKVLLEATTPQRCVTISGDVAQRLVFDNAFRDWQGLLRDTGYPVLEVRPLRLSYRSTAEIMRFAREVLGPLADPEEPLVARQGVPIELHRFGDLGEAVAFLGESLRALSSREPTASVAVIARYPEQADAFYTALVRAEVPNMRRVRRHDFPFTAGIDITDVTQVKGLEFDYVILAEVTPSSYPDSIESRHLLHIAATRAAHQLWIVSTGEPSPLVPPYLLTP